MTPITKFTETKQRSIVKAVTYRLIIITADSLLVFLVTRRLQLALVVVAVSNIYSTLLYFGHERLWNGLKWGKIKTN